jgi:hypothetical protein
MVGEGVDVGMIYMLYPHQPTHTHTLLCDKSKIDRIIYVEGIQFALRRKIDTFMPLSLNVPSIEFCLK